MDGIIPIWKERGMTSFDCVFQVRKLLKTKKVGHSGTLDPEVDGVLPICVGKATKVVEFLLESNKVYRGEITLGIATETEDAHGRIVEQRAVQSSPSVEEIDRTMQKMEGELIQIPPMYSAVKVNGKRLYEYARAGQTVERPRRTVQIFSFERTSEPILNKQQQTVSWQFEVSCSKGTYVRTLAVDLGKALGYPAHMSQLTRTKSGHFTQEQCVTITQLAQAVATNEVEHHLFPIEYALEQYPTIVLSEILYQQVKNGAVLHEDHFPPVPSFPVVCLYDGKLVALYNRHSQREGYIKPQKMF